MTFERLTEVVDGLPAKIIVKHLKRISRETSKDINQLFKELKTRSIGRFPQPKQIAVKKLIENETKEKRLFEKGNKLEEQRQFSEALEVYKYYLEIYPKGEFEEAVKQGISRVKDAIFEIKDEQAWQDAKQQAQLSEQQNALQQAIRAYEDYIQNYRPNGSHLGEAQIAIKKLNVKIKNLVDKRAWEKVERDAHIWIHKVEETRNDDFVQQINYYEKAKLVYNQYLANHSNGEFKISADNSISIIDTEIERIKKGILQQLIDSPEKLNVRELLRNGGLNPEDLYRHNVITPKGLNIYLNRPTFPKQKSPTRLLQEKRTDVYFFGLPQSGKSCILGGILLQANQNQALTIHPQNETGALYGMALKQFTKLGITPPRTSILVDALQYIEASFWTKNKKGKRLEHPLNIIEMGGEVFEATFRTQSSAHEQLVSLINSYLSNDNPKVLFFVIDYKVHASRGNIGAFSQDDKMDMVLGKLDGKGVLQKTDGIFVVVSKFDLLIKELKEELKRQPNQQEIETKMNRFLLKEYPGFMGNVQKFAKKNKIRRHAPYPFSLGRVMLGKVFDYEPKYSENLYNILRKTAHYIETNRNRDGWFTRVFNL